MTGYQLFALEHPKPARDGKFNNIDTKASFVLGKMFYKKTFSIFYSVKNEINAISHNTKSASEYKSITCRHLAALSLVESIERALWYNSLAVDIFPSFHSIHPQA